MASKEARSSGRPKPKTPQWRDLPFCILALIILIGFIVVAAIDLADYRATQCFKIHFGDPRVVFFEPIILGLVGTSILITFVLTGIYYCVAAMYTHHFILASMILQIIVSFGSAIFYLCEARWLSGAFSILWLVVSCVMYWLLRAHIGIATIQLDVSMRFSGRNPAILLVSILGGLFCAAWSILVGSVTLAGFGKAITEDCSRQHMRRPEGEFLGVLAYLALCNYLVSEFVKAVVKFIISYTYGRWSFIARDDRVFMTDADSRQIVYDEYPSMATATADGVIGALTYGIGTLFLSSLVLALMKLGAQAFSAWSQTLLINGPRQGSQDVSAILLAWVMSNCISYLDSVLNHFTNYIIVFVAMDNESYMEAFSRSFNMLVNKGMDALINDSLACGTLTFGSWCIGAIVALIVYLYMDFVQAYPPEGVYFICAFVMMVNVQVSGIITAGISSGTQVLFVALYVEPGRFCESHPHLFEVLDTYYNFSGAHS